MQRVNGSRSRKKASRRKFAKTANQVEGEKEAREQTKKERNEIAQKMKKSMCRTHDVSRSVV